MDSNDIYGGLMKLTKAQLAWLLVDTVRTAEIGIEEPSFTSGVVRDIRQRIIEKASA